jgi:RimJ/RimL family protein N-acetyltransferase
MQIDLQPILENEKAILYPLRATDFDDLYQVASDPGIWEQHPNKDRWKKEVFRIFFQGALQSEGAFKIVDKHTGATIGSTRFYDHDPHDQSVLIGYTFYARNYWGKGFNPAVKVTMLQHIFQFVSRVYFHVGAENMRSQVAMARLGAEKVGEQEVAYFGEPPKLNVVYVVEKENWKV